MTLSSPMVEYIEGTRAISELPAAPTTGVLIVAHGCRCRLENFWSSSQRCLGCIGLLEDIAITTRVLRKQFVVLIVASAGDCWSLGKEVGEVHHHPLHAPRDRRPPPGRSCAGALASPLLLFLQLGPARGGRRCR
ncbi:hypothetical protein ZWY2020_010220 [Hordeum vulgare]|nr:hypothetical protein ZWY2020_010220 [Hordeum vulgare]